MKFWILISAAIFGIPVFQSLPIAEKNLGNYKDVAAKIESFLKAIILQKNDKPVSKMHHISVRAAGISNDTSSGAATESDRSKKDINETSKMYAKNGNLESSSTTENQSGKNKLNAAKITENPQKHHQETAPGNISKSTENANNSGLGLKSESVSRADESPKKEKHTMHSPHQKASSTEGSKEVKINDGEVEGNSARSNHTVHLEKNNISSINQDGNRAAAESLENGSEMEYRHEETTDGNSKNNQKINLDNIISTTTSSKLANQNESPAHKLEETNENTKFHQNDEIPDENIKMISKNATTTDTEAVLDVSITLFRSKELSKNEVDAEKDEISKTNSEGRKQMTETTSSKTEVEQPEKKREDANTSNIAENSLKGVSTDLHSSNVIDLPRINTEQNTNTLTSSLTAGAEQSEKKLQELNVPNLMESNLTSPSLDFRHIILFALPHAHIVETNGSDSSKIEVEQNNVKEMNNVTRCIPVSCIATINSTEAPSDTVNKY